MSKKVLLAVAAIACVSSLVSCDSKSNVNYAEITNTIHTSIKEVKTATLGVSITDSDVEVYKLVRDIIITRDGTSVTGTVNDQVTSLGLNYEMRTNYSSSTYQGSDAETTLFNYSIDGALFTDASYTDGVLSGKVSKDNAASFLNVANSGCDSEVEFTIMLSEEKLASVSLSYTNTESHSVVLTASYVY